MKLNKRQKKALENIAYASRTSISPDDYIIPGKFGSGIGDVTLNSLIDLGLLESGPSKRYYGSKGYRPTELGKKVNDEMLK
ncbi:hypothetical protein Q4560_05845 [Celeribacter halophilus]|uniref:hypothetical protein n=1 Tax=Celeribacter halophilus TaxID=576117 RepID=UPI0026E2B412|nr:hypothetical protein [Celeribacter halophilus]MDO6722779.1 hypothetical protein [Celeribacter halophilus]